MHEGAERWAGVMSVESDLEQEFETRLRECSTLAFRVAFSVLRHREDAEDVAQEAFAKAYRSFRQLRDRDRFRAWLVRMTWRMALDRRRGDRRRLVREDRLQPPDSVAPDVESAERAERLWQAIDLLSEKLRVVIVLAAIEGYDVREVARLLALPEGTVKSRLFLARQQLKRALAGLA
ncbi:MAG TPA: sigma-70 family RNA polymerase sigma factor [Vicinamibacterales bacterium]|nr:sigma-70 family RNA polymerase sigma factor [Vicinamibacterales bacterium]